MLPDGWYVLVAVGVLLVWLGASAALERRRRRRRLGTGRSWGVRELQPGQAGWTCSTCVFYDGPVGADLDGAVGQCRFHPPPDRSEVSARDFCGYHVELMVRGGR